MGSTGKQERHWHSHVGWDCNTNGAGEASRCYQSSQYDAILSWGNSLNLNYVFSPGYVCPSGWAAFLSSTYGYTADTDYDIGATSVIMVPGDILTAVRRKCFETIRA